jgi:hypothetical protein
MIINIDTKKVFKISILIVIVCVASISSYFLGKNGTRVITSSIKSELAIYPPSETWNLATELDPRSITCQFDYTTIYSTTNGIVSSLTNKESSPIKLTFSALGTSDPVMGGGQLGTDNISVIQNDEEKYLIFESAPLKYGNISAFRIDKKARTASWTKMYALPGTTPMPITLASMGYCW